MVDSHTSSVKHFEVTQVRLNHGEDLYVAYDTGSWCKVAVKVFPSHFADKERHAAGLREANLLFKASGHPNVCHVLAVNSEPKRFYL